MMLVHSSSWGDAERKLSSIFHNINNRRKKELIGKWFGYGVPSIERVLECTEQRATVIGYGKLSDGQAHEFALPLPASLGQSGCWRRLTLTLAWMSPIAVTTERYRKASLWFELDNKIVANNNKEVDFWTARRGTIQHQVYEGTRATFIPDDYSLKIKVNCRKDAADFEEPVVYGLGVTLEIAEGVGITIYDEIRARMAQEVPITI